MRTHLGCQDDAFGCMGNGEDAEGVRGVFLRRNVIAVAGRALKANLTRLGPLVLPITELVRAPVWHLAPVAARRGGGGGGGVLLPWEPHVYASWRVSCPREQCRLWRYAGGCSRMPGATCAGAD